MADELQDWGRPVGPRGMCAIRDAKIETGPRHLDVHYRMTDRTEAFHGTDYSLLEHAVGKLLALSSISIGDPPGDSSARVQFEGPGPFHLVYSPHNARLDEILEPEMQIVGKISRDTIQDSPRKEKVSLTEDDLLIAVKRNDAVANDFLFVSKGKTQIGNLSWDFFDSICFDPTAVRITHRQEHLVLEKPTYMRGRSADALKNAFRRTGGVSDTCSLILFEAARIEKHQEAADISVREALSSAPEANFLDLDWRFSPDTCERVCKAVVQIAEKWFGSDNLQICYLACPSLAVWHNNFFSSIDFKLLDRGHAAIQYWKEHHYLPNDAMRVRDYDVRDPVPKDLRNTFHVVVLDPPWYDEYYGRFLARTLELLREPFGIVGIAEYPAYDFAKQQRFALARGAILALDKPVLTMDIWYETPPFDRFVPESWAFRAGAKYRPSYLEFYKCADGSSKPPKTELPPPHYFFPVSKGTLSVNFNSKLVDQNSMNLRAPGSLFAYRYKSLERPTQPDLAKTLAWTSSNLVVRVEKSKKAAYERLAEEIRATGNVLDFICELEKQYP
ncbi:hypothetical protein FJY63_08165 [Candidatus Sumerlaeota bacterium]|nr:hypothetical protein [Candidatus Sumerlaeota bacterium]